ncbi:hypothetical protein F4809DRAFT_599278 [Biscogniauxia mediterranea]|nr:hypothetical protein F4809DRAFT_599278 [Biscogniauxia mediterranea]
MCLIFKHTAHQPSYVWFAHHFVIANHSIVEESHFGIQIFTFTSQRFHEDLNKEVGGIPAIFYVVEKGEEPLIRYWIQHGGKSNATCGPDGFPLLAFAILRDARTCQQPTTTARTLLEPGSSPKAIPLSCYFSFNKVLSEPEDGDSDEVPEECQCGSTQNALSYFR